MKPTKKQLQQIENINSDSEELQKSLYKFYELIKKNPRIYELYKIYAKQYPPEYYLSKDFGNIPLRDQLTKIEKDTEIMLRIIEQDYHDLEQIIKNISPPDSPDFRNIIPESKESDKSSESRLKKRKLCNKKTN